MRAVFRNFKLFHVEQFGAVALNYFREDRPQQSMNKQLEITPNLEALFGTRDENLHLLEG